VRHLGTRVSAYVDGHLAGRRLRAAERHLRGCARCRAEVAAERHLAAQLRALGEAEVPSGLAARIGDPPSRCEGLLASMRDRLSLPAVRRRVAVRAAAGGGAVIMVAGAVVAMGATSEAAFDGAALLATPSPAAVARATLVADPPVPAWVVPELPEDVRMSSATLRRVADRDVVSVDVVGPGGSATMLQVRGVVDPDSVPEHAIVVQCGDVAVVVTGDAVVRDVVAEGLPARGRDASPVGLWERGLDVLASVVREVVR